MQFKSTLVVYCTLLHASLVSRKKNINKQKHALLFNSLESPASKYWFGTVGCLGGQLCFFYMVFHAFRLQKVLFTKRCYFVWQVWKTKSCTMVQPDWQLKLAERYIKAAAEWENIRNQSPVKETGSFAGLNRNRLFQCQVNNLTVTSWN